MPIDATLARGNAPTPPDPVAASAGIAARAADAASSCESARRLDAGLVSAMADAGLFRMLVPRALGGAETDPATLVDVLAEVARGDGAAGWCAMIASTTGVLSAWLPDDEASAIFGDPRRVNGGVFHPGGRAIACDDGFRVSGRWTFASGCEHSDWLLGGALVFDAPDAVRPRLRPDGAPDARLFFFPASDVRIHDTWSTSGLRGTGSHDIEVQDLLVPAGRAAWPADPASRGEPLYRFPVFGLLALGIAGVALGIARGAIDDLVALANEKVPTGGRRKLAERSATQADVARAEALVAGGRALVRDAITPAWERARRGEDLGLRDRALLRLAATDAVRRAAEAVDLMYEAGGGSAIHDASPLSRRFRDIHVVTQHAMVAKPTYEVAGRVLLGLDPGSELL